MDNRGLETRTSSTAMGASSREPDPLLPDEPGDDTVPFSRPRPDSAALGILDALFAGSADVAMLVGLDGRVLHAAGASQDLFGEPVSALLAAPVTAFVHPDDRKRFNEELAGVLTSASLHKGFETRIRHASGRHVAARIELGNRLDDPHLRACVLLVRRAAALGASDDSAEGRLPDRGGLLAVLEGAVQRKQEHYWQASRFARQTMRDRRLGFSLLIAEFDRFRQLEANLGGEAVHEFERVLVRRLQAMLRPDDSLARIARGEYAIVLDGIEAPLEAERVAARFQASLERPVALPPHGQVASTVTVGIATSERPYERAEDALRDALAAVVRARKTSKRRLAFRSLFRSEDAREVKLVADIHDALDRGEFQVHYQPIISLARRELVGFEALVRWYHPERGLVFPGEFVALAEEAGLIGPMGEHVLRLASRQMAAWHGAYGHLRPSLAVNLSPAQVADEGLVSRIEALLREARLPPEFLQLEITETAVLADSDGARRVLSMLKLFGVKVVLDDFGTGYSCLTHLHRLPLDGLKIDRSFVVGLTEDGESASIVGAILALGRSLGLDVVAEGVETLAQRATLERMNCPHAQGYLFAKPVDAGQAEALLASARRW